jgi:hypothetical protein
MEGPPSAPGILASDLRLVFVRETCCQPWAKSRSSDFGFCGVRLKRIEWDRLALFEIDSDVREEKSILHEEI